MVRVFLVVAMVGCVSVMRPAAAEHDDTKKAAVGLEEPQKKRFIMNTLPDITELAEKRFLLNTLPRIDTHKRFIMSTLPKLSDLSKRFLTHWHPTVDKLQETRQEKTEAGQVNKRYIMWGLPNLAQDHMLSKSGPSPVVPVLDKRYTMWRFPGGPLNDGTLQTPDKRFLVWKFGQLDPAKVDKRFVIFRLKNAKNVLKFPPTGSAGKPVQKQKSIGHFRKRRLANGLMKILPLME